MSFTLPQRSQHSCPALAFDGCAASCGGTAEEPLDNGGGPVTDRRSREGSQAEACGLYPLDHQAPSGGASPLAALLLPHILPVCSVVAPCHPGAALRNPLLL